MAAQNVAVVVTVGGYDASFLLPVSEDLECPVCSLVLKEPLQTPCGHLVCKTCIDRMTRNGQFRCPLDNQLWKRAEAFPDRNVERKVLCLEVRCDRHTEGCNWTGPLNYLQKHMAPEGGCEVLEIACEFSHIGCAYKGFKPRLQEHSDSSAEYHMGLLLRRVAQQDLMLGEQKEQLVSQEEKIVKQEQRVSEQQRVIARLERIVRELELTKKGSMDDSTSMNDQLNSPKVMGAASVMDQTFEWKIVGWASKLEEARQGKQNSITSHPFYIGRPGYKFSISLYPNGRKDGKGTHLAIYVAILKGQYDDELSWPFAGRCTVSIVDQDGQGRSPARSFNAQALLPDASRNFIKPVSSQNEGRGWQKYMSHGELMSWPFLTKHDTLVLRFECSEIIPGR